MMILDVKDVEWANATLAPMGLSKDHQPVVRAPASLAGPILSALRNVDAIPHFRETLKTSTLGRTVNAFRSHQNPEISKLAKELVSSWKKVLQRGPSPETRQIRKDNKRRERDEARAEEEEAAKRARGDQPESNPAHASGHRAAIGHGERSAHGSSVQSDEPSYSAQPWQTQGQSLPSTPRPGLCG